MNLVVVHTDTHESPYPGKGHGTVGGGGGAGSLHH